jgi:Protein of unknown function (DUF4058)
MPSPFPGMDPYLESPDWFPDLHDELIFRIKGKAPSLLTRVLRCAASVMRIRWEKSLCTIGSGTRY